jgi:isoquinoline 1-oxidoreductase
MSRNIAIRNPKLEISRRTFIQALGAGILITVTEGPSSAQRRGGGGGGSMPVVARLHLNEDGTISVMSGKVEEGQGARTELSQAAAEELRVPFDRIRIVMADTDFVPDDGITAIQCASHAPGGGDRARAADAPRGCAVAGGRGWPGSARRRYRE